MNGEIVKKLLLVLEQEIDIYNRLRILSKDKTDIIIHNKVNELDKIIKSEQTLILELGKMEAARESLVQEAAAVMNIEQSELTITDIVKHLDAESAVKLKACQDKLTGILKELKNANDMNSKLVKNSLDFINFSMNLIADAGNSGNNYGQTGQMNEAKKRNLFDRKL